MGKISKLLLLALFAATLTGCGIEQINEGYRGIKQEWGKVQGEPLLPGLHFYNPISSSIMELSVLEEKQEGKTSCFTADTQNVEVSFTITYYPDPLKIGALYSQFGKKWDEKIVSQAVLGSLKDSIGQYKADDLVGKREAVKKVAEKEIRESLAQRGVTFTRLDITNLDFDDQYEKAVEAKVTAIQRAAEAKNQTVQVEEQAKQTLMTATAAAKAMQIKSQALQQNKGLVQYEAVQKWDGALPQFILGGGAMPILDLKGLTSGKE